jgi:hypothetical protein
VHARHVCPAVDLAAVDVKRRFIARTIRRFLRTFAINGIDARYSRRVYATLFRPRGLEPTVWKPGFGPAVCEADFEIGTPGHGFAERVLVDADFETLFEGGGVEKAFVGVVETGFGHVGETRVEAADDFVAVHGVAHAVDAGEFVDGCVGCGAFGVETAHLTVDEEGGVVAVFLHHVLDAGCAVADPAVLVLLYPYDAKTSFSVAHVS